MVCSECGEIVNVIGKRFECCHCGMKGTVKWLLDQYVDPADAMLTEREARGK